MTVKQFRSHDYLPGAWAKELATNHILQKVLEVMNDNHPAHFAIPGDGNSDVSPTRAAIELGLTRGYSKYHETLLLLARRELKSKDVGETTYDKPPDDIKLYVKQ
jgi:hypothetical protein